jgi:ABC-type phosphate transport system permease subunit
VPGPLRTLTLRVSVPVMSMGVTVLVGCGGMVGSRAVALGRAGGETVADAVATGWVGPQAAVSRLSSAIRMMSFFIFLILAQIKSQPVSADFLEF